MTIPDLKKIRKLEEELAAEKRKLADWNKKPNDDHKLAELLHGRFCKSNHTDGCGWYYETGSSHPARHDPWTVGYAHKRWLETARKFKRTAAAIKRAVKNKSGYALSEAIIKEWPDYLW